MRGLRSRVGVGALALALALCALGLAMPAAPSSQAGPVLEREKDCADFNSQAAAQDYFDDNGGSPSNNVDGLDADGDGKACESNPCPCANPGGGGGGGGGGGDGGSGGGGNGDDGGSKGGSKDKQGARVVSVTDGDTIKVRMGGREHNVRLIGIDTPEVYFGEECGGAKASKSMKKMLDRGDWVNLIRDRSQDARDSYGRLLRYVERRGDDVGRKQIKRGWAQVYVYERAFKRVRDYRRTRDRARRGDRGAWDRCDGDFHKPL